MKTTDQRSVLNGIRAQAEMLADALDPKRTRTAPDEITRAVVKALDQIVHQASRALSMLDLAPEED